MPRSAPAPAIAVASTNGNARTFAIPVALLGDNLETLMAAPFARAIASGDSDDTTHVNVTFGARAATAVLATGDDPGVIVASAVIAARDGAPGDRTGARDGRRVVAEHVATASEMANPGAFARMLANPAGRLDRAVAALAALNG